jgi:hypothetical protein
VLSLKESSARGIGIWTSVAWGYWALVAAFSTWATASPATGCSSRRTAAMDRHRDSGSASSPRRRRQPSAPDRSAYSGDRSAIWRPASLPSRSERLSCRRSYRRDSGLRDEVVRGRGRRWGNRLKRLLAAAGGKEAFVVQFGGDAIGHGRPQLPIADTQASLLHPSCAQTADAHPPLGPYVVALIVTARRGLHSRFGCAEQLYVGLKTKGLGIQIRLFASMRLKQNPRSWRAERQQLDGISSDERPPRRNQLARGMPHQPVPQVIRSSRCRSITSTNSPTCSPFGTTALSLPFPSR